MSQENVEIVRRIYEAWNRVDLDAAFRLTGADFEWETDARLPNAGIYRGREEIQRLFEDQAAAFERSEIEIERLLAKDDDVVALIRLRRRPMGSNADIEVQIGHVWTFRDGKIVRGQAFAQRGRALEAAGLRE